MGGAVRRRAVHRPLWSIRVKHTTKGGLKSIQHAWLARLFLVLPVSLQWQLLFLCPGIRMVDDL